MDVDLWPSFRCSFALRADLLVLRVRKFVDIEDDEELLPLARDVVLAEEGDVDGVREGRR